MQALETEVAFEASVVPCISLGAHGSAYRVRTAVGSVESFGSEIVFCGRLGGLLERKTDRERRENGAFCTEQKTLRLFAKSSRGCCLVPPCRSRYRASGLRSTRWFGATAWSKLSCRGLPSPLRHSVVVQHAPSGVVLHVVLGSPVYSLFTRQSFWPPFPCQEAHPYVSDVVSILSSPSRATPQPDDAEQGGRKRFRCEVGGCSMAFAHRHTLVKHVKREHQGSSSGGPSHGNGDVKGTSAAGKSGHGKGSKGQGGPAKGSSEAPRRTLEPRTAAASPASMNTGGAAGARGREGAERDEEQPADFSEERTAGEKFTKESDGGAVTPRPVSATPLAAEP